MRACKNSCVYHFFFVSLQTFYTAYRMQEIIQYIIEFLLYGNKQAAQLVGYTNNSEEWSNYKVIIKPNGHFGKELVYPDLTEIKLSEYVPTIDTNKQDDYNEEKIVHIIETDIVYTTFFFISRAEELLDNRRDEHGRFLAKYSILGTNNRLMIPLVDEYARMLMKLLEIDLPKPNYTNIYLSHDIDSLAQYRHLRGAIGGILRGEIRAVAYALRAIQHDPIYTFSWLISHDKTVDRAEVIYFVKDTPGKGYDYPQYKLTGIDYLQTHKLLNNSGARIGWHSSYFGAPSPLKQQDKTINYQLHRSHYLRCSIDQMQRLVDMGVKDDFTMMFADHIGFRLQTTRAVKWINPKTWQLTNLTLHPMTIMDCTLSNEQYMQLTEDEAYFLCQQLFEKIYQNAGEVILLWHNSIISKNGYHRSLYPKLLNILREKQ